MRDSISQVEDYIVSCGTYGIWTYRKYNSGYAECECEATLNGTWISWGNMYVLEGNPVTFPFEFVQTPMTSIWRIGCDGGSVSFFDGSQYSGANNTTTFYPAILRPNAGNNDTNYYIGISVRGHWK